MRLLLSARRNIEYCKASYERRLDHLARNCFRILLKRVNPGHALANDQGMNNVRAFGGFP